MSIMSVSELQQFLETEFPQGPITVESLGPMTATIRYATSEKDLRPGRTLSGPTIMAAADTAMYAVLLAEIGPVPLAVTTSLNINFLRKPSLGNLMATAQLLKLGKRLAVGEMKVFSQGDPLPVAHVTATYSIPPR